MVCCGAAGLCRFVFFLGVAIGWFVSALGLLWKMCCCGFWCGTGVCEVFGGGSVNSVDFCFSFHLFLYVCGIVIGLVVAACLRGLVVTVGFVCLLCMLFVVCCVWVLHYLFCWGVVKCYGLVFGALLCLVVMLLMAILQVLV